MFALYDRPTRLCDGISRREVLRVGGLSALGLSLPQLLQAEAHAAAQGGTFGRAKNVIYLWLQGGPPQHETFDPKPDAPAEVRGEFKPIRTNIPGVHICELLPRTAAIMDKLAVVRSLCTHSDLHDASGYWVLTGTRYTGQESRKISPTDWPYFGSIVKMLRPSKELPAYSSAWLPDVMRLNDNVQPAGQTGGFLGRRWDPERIICDPSDPNFQVQGLSLPPELPPVRLSQRRGLLDQVERHFAALEKGPALQHHDRQVREAFGVLTSGRARRAFDLAQEPPKVRERYGPGKWAPCLILARRLIEAGARLVHVNWVREGGDTAVANPMWDTHTQNADRLQDVLCPMFDVGFTALIEDLDRRGLLAETLVVAIGEFGRTPKINKDGGRDHWGHVFSFALAGAGVRGGTVYGASDRHGAYPADNKVEPQDLTATLFHLLGIGHEAFFPHPTGRPIRVTEGEPLYPILGSGPATDRRCPPGGDLALVPPYSDALLLDTAFEGAGPLPKVQPGKRLKGWQVSPRAGDHPLAVVLAQAHPQLGPRTGRHFVTLGHLWPRQGRIARGDRAILTQEVRSPRAGRFHFLVHARGAGASAQHYRDFFLKHFTCRLSIFGYTDERKDPTGPVRQYAAVDFQPPFIDGQADRYEQFKVSARLRSQDDGAREIERGVGVAVIVEKTSPGDLDVAGVPGAFICIDDVQLIFDPRPRDDSVQV